MFAKRTWTDVFFAVVLPICFILAVYYFFFRPVEIEEEVARPGVEAHARGARVKEALQVLETIHFTDAESMLNSPAFKSLTDFTVPIVEEEYGRENPFTRPDVLERRSAASAAASSKATPAKIPSTRASISAGLDATRQGL